jgi:ubiquitin C-terminal hydrolase
MNSSIQCIANTYELTTYFLERKYKSLVERENKNPLGTDGRIVLAWAKLIGEMWYGSGNVVRPDLFKRILGQYNVTFEGYGQHDSQECINTVLDFMAEDLFKHNKKPYVEQTDAEGKTDEEASQEAWNKHVYRNESIILDLFHGQYKSTVVCSLCKRLSITFDPFLMVALPIPTTKWENISGYIIQYDQNEDTYSNFRVQVKVKDNERVAGFRKAIEEVYGFDASSFLITWVCDMKVEKLFNNTQRIKDLTEQKQGVLLLF